MYMYSGTSKQRTLWILYEFKWFVLYRKSAFALFLFELLIIWDIEDYPFLEVLLYIQSALYMYYTWIHNVTCTHVLVCISSATWPPGVRRLINAYMKEGPYQVTVGSLDLRVSGCVSPHNQRAVEIWNIKIKTQSESYRNIKQYILMWIWSHSLF